MNKLEYIPGDLVRYTSLYKEPIAEICEIRETSYLIRYMNGNFAKVTNEEINPIPLTPEILEKSGWKHKNEFGEYWFIPRNEDYEFLALDKVGEEWAIYIEENCSNFEYIKFVHQLQHLLFGLGINHEMEV